MKFGVNTLIWGAKFGPSDFHLLPEIKANGFDGVEVRSDGSILVASQADSSIHLFRGGEGRALFKVAGRPADIAYDTRRNRVVVPYIARNRIEIWQLAP